MICRKCQTELPDGAKFCLECGTSLEAVCSNCHASNPPHFTFWGTCGRKLTSPEHGRPPTDLSFDEQLAKIQEYLSLKKAQTIFEEMGMDYWLSKAQEALARL